MSNSEMIGAAFQMNGLVYSKKEYDTFAGWKRRGRKISKGQKSVVKTQMWRPKKVKDEEGTETTKMYMVTGHFFHIGQTEETK